MIETLTTAVIVLAACLVGLALSYNNLLSDQNKRIERIKKDTGALEQENKTLCKPDVVFELQKDLQERCDRAIDLKEENRRLEDENEQLKKELKNKNRIISKRLVESEIHQKLMAQLEVNTALRLQIEDLESEINDRDEWERLKTEQEDE